MGDAYDRGRNAGRAFWRALAPLVLLLGFAASAAAADDRKICMQSYEQGVKEADESLEEACARWIKSGSARGKDLAAAYYTRAQSLTRRLEYDRALQEQNEAIRLWPDSAYYRRERGAIYALMENYERALADFDEAVRLNPKDANIHYWFGYIYEKRQDYERSIAEYTTAIKLSPKDAEFYARRCETYILKREYDRALPDCDEGIRRDPKSGGHVGYVRRCEIYAAKGEIDRALRDCDDEIRQNPQSISGHLWRGFIHEQKRDAARAIAGYQQALAIDPMGKDIHIPSAIGQTLEDVRAYLAGLQAAAAGGVAAVPAQGDARTILERRGLLGVWSANCNVAPSPDNAYAIYRAIDERRVQRDVMIGPTQRSEAGIIEAVTDTGDEIAYLLTGATRDETIVRVAGNRTRVVEVARNGTRTIANGSYLPAYGDAAVAGKETPWTTKCAP